MIYMIHDFQWIDCRKVEDCAVKKNKIFEDKFYPPDLNLDDSLDDEELFRQAMADVTRLRDRQRRIRVRKSLDSELPDEMSGSLTGEEDPERVFLEAINSNNDWQFFLLNEYVEGGARAWDTRLLKKLREGRFAVQAELDLHGFGQREAIEQLEQFIVDCCKRGLSCVRVIHGRGKNSRHTPVLKNKVERWLSRRSSSRYVVAYTSARPVDGGGGAIYVLLRCS